MFIGLFKLRNRIWNKGLELRVLAGDREVENSGRYTRTGGIPDCLEAWVEVIRLLGGLNMNEYHRIELFHASPKLSSVYNASYQAIFLFGGQTQPSEAILAMYGHQHSNISEFY
jgi:hypothetical protein